ncbi:ATP-dependent DNA helicase RecQ [Rhodopirellula islandica]|uniref:DNA helicase RecQ n=1 Tax=Rhodopirellula islandica TaxID=595434 RepID=A0A0J1EEQ3_RHOIS|nr:DNA helicase RecQ [Rhodopirellula islandica]KLU03979.1 ATP-dependent DNA helicase RecQ [Rhodopirellula islandica]
MSSPSKSTSTLSQSTAPDTEMDQAHSVLRSVWGYDSFRPLQADAVQDVVRGRDSLVVLPTGGGKSLCYQVPALVRDGMSVVVSPLISLMKDQVDALTANGVAAALVNSTQSMDQKRETADRIRRGEIKILYLAPERLLTPKTLAFLRSLPISFFAIDEAHCVSNWGHDFRPEYRGLRILKEQFPAASVHAFTATASQQVRDDITEQLQLHEPRVLVGNFDRPNLTYRMLRSDGKLNQIQQCIQQHRGESGVVYCITRKEVEQTAAALESMGVRTLPYHAGLAAEIRQANQEAFIQEKVDVIVATVAFGMGIDKSNVRFVIHAGMPKSIEHYQQESGRAGRDGLAAECVLIHSGGDLMSWKRILENGDRNNFQSAMGSVEAMASLCNGVQCRHASLVEYFGQEYDADNCDACDVCLGELDVVEDPITLAQKILSCVVRLKERYGVAHTVKVLTGSKDQKVIQAGHDQLSTYNLLSNEGANAVRTWIEQLISQNHLIRTGEYQSLRLTESGRALLKREGDVTLTKVSAKSSSRRPAANASWEGVDRQLFDHLRSLRSEMASERGVPAYVIFGDAVLRELARVRPTSIDKLTHIRGIGDRKREEFGQLFLDSIDQYCEKNPLVRDQSDNTAPAPINKPRANTAPNAAMVQAFQLFRDGRSASEVAEKMGRAESTVSKYLSDFIQSENITDPTQWVPKEEAEAIRAALLAAEDERLRPVFEALNEEMSYEKIRIVATCMKNEMADDADD